MLDNPKTEIKADQNLQEKNPLEKTLEKYKDFEVVPTKDLPDGNRTLIALGWVGGLSNAALGWVKSGWIGFVSVDIFLLCLALVVFWRKHHDTKR